MTFMMIHAKTTLLALAQHYSAKLRVKPLKHNQFKVAQCCVNPIRSNHIDFRQIITLIGALVFSTNTFASSAYDQIPANEIKHITIDGKPSTVLVRPWLGKMHFGAAIIIGPSSKKANANPPGITHFLRTHLNPLGWATISVTPTVGLYYPNYSTSPEAVSKAGEKQLALNTSKPTPKFQSDQLLQQRNFQHKQLNDTINALTEVGQAYPGKRLMIAIDDSAAIITQLLYEEKIPKPDTLILINPYREFDQEMAKGEKILTLATQLQALNIPILDLQSPDGHPVSVAQAPNRFAKNNIKPIRYYVQYPLTLNLNSEAGWQEALEYIKGFARRTPQY
ncbi:DUF3530 family protein [Shewanella intestini]|uniref:DUF3530 family protein n=1 Tax=Shewanella intestini TaxID=2017544 RepID=A0ABS5I0Q1_9GAMM|nr:MULTISPECIES: DUF3530 family protein [Shewanella]MBR9727597.1 DUF3530 family protein [Shewanella intestini]